MDEVKKALEQRLVATFHEYIRHAFEHALDERERHVDVLQVIINLQTALELLSKLYTLRREGWKGIVDPKFHKKHGSEIRVFGIYRGIPQHLVLLLVREGFMTFEV